MHKGFGYCLSVLIVLAVFTAQISPACAFISGNSSVIQICAANGSVQSVEVDASFDPFSQPKPSPNDDLKTMEKCPFCFASSHQQYGEVLSSVIMMPALPRYLITGAGSAIPVHSDLRAFEPRGPPAFS